MSAGARPEGFDGYMTTIREASVEVLQTLSDQEQRIWIPALIMSIVSVAKQYSEENEGLDFEAMVSLVHEGIDALTNDFIREELANGN